jgi:iron complex transport system permease protein
VPRGIAVLLALTAVLIVAAVVALAFGSTWVPARDVLGVLLRRSGDHDIAAVVIERVRLPRAITAAFAGAALGVAGLQMQTLFRNPLADPFALGISAGASLGVALVLLGTGYGAAAAFGTTVGLAGDALVTAAAFAGALAVLTLVLLVSSRIASPTTILVLGLMFGYAASAGVTVLIGATAPERLMQLAQWSFGSFSGVTWERLWLFVPVIAAGLLIAAATTKQLNALLLGEEYARSMGVAVKRVRWLTMIGASALGAVVTAFCGPIAFLGIAVPHLCRGLLGSSDHRWLVPASVLLGAALALAAQVISLLPGGSNLLPLNAVTSLIGAPVVVAVIVRSRRGAFVG